VNSTQSLRKVYETFTKSLRTLTKSSPPPFGRLSSLFPFLSPPFLALVPSSVWPFCVVAIRYYVWELPYIHRGWHHATVLTFLHIRVPSWTSHLPTVRGGVRRGSRRSRYANFDKHRIRRVPGQHAGGRGAHNPSGGSPHAPWEGTAHVREGYASCQNSTADPEGLARQPGIT
jgi:hypothetical protein